MNPDLKLLQPYPFEKLNALKAQVTAPSNLNHIALSIGEPKHKAPDFIKDVLAENFDKLSNYPATKGMPELSEAITQWLQKRFNIPKNTIDAPSNVIPVNGTREAIFSFTQALINRNTDQQQTKAVSKKPLVVSPNPFYQIYEGAAYLAGAQPHFLPCLEGSNFIPDFNAVSEDIWQRCQLLFLCSPGNPTGAVVDKSTLMQLISLADTYDFVIASDECYSELYFDEENPPTGLLQVCADMGRNDFRRCVVFHSLSKRSNLPGLRSGFIAGDAELLTPYLQYRTYHGSAMPIQHQLASIAAWSDEAHVKDNRDQYREKFDAVLNILGDDLNVSKPDASFYLWAQTPIADTDFAQQLFAQQNITVLPGSFLGRTIEGINPGENRVRMALVASLAECIEAAHRIKAFLGSL